MMKQLSCLLLPLFFLFGACSSDGLDSMSNDAPFDEVSSVIANLPLSSIDLPDNFVLGETYTIDFQYTLPSECYYYESLDYSVVNSTEIILAVEVYVDLESSCDQAEKEGENSFVITIDHNQDYKFKLWKGTNAQGDDVFEDFIVPVSITDL